MLTSAPRLLDRLPPVRGLLQERAPLAGLSWFRTGGPAEVLYRPADADDLSAFLRELDPAIDVTVIGLGSNTLVRDGGVDGVVVTPGKAFSEISFDGLRVSAGAGAAGAAVARACRDRAVAELEFLAGIPGTIGGALRMNAGAYGKEIADIVVDARAFDRQGRPHVLSRAELGLAYRSCAADEDWIFISARFEGKPGRRDEIARRMDDIADRRKSTQPVQSRTGGSTFRNPDAGSAWELIEAAGCRGLAVGGAAVSERHCNFLVNDGTATAADIEALGERIRERVLARCGVTLEWEIRLIGQPAGRSR